MVFQVFVACSRSCLDEKLFVLDTSLFELKELCVRLVFDVDGQWEIGARADLMHDKCKQMFVGLHVEDVLFFSLHEGL